MKNLTLILLLLSSSAFGSENGNLWLALSAASQNLAYSLRFIPADIWPNYSVYEEKINEVNRIIGNLVDAGELDSFEVSLKGNEIEALWDDKEFMKLKGSLIERYGAYVALDLLDLGSRIRFIAIKENQPVELTIRIPHKDMQVLKDILKIKAQNQPEVATP